MDRLAQLAADQRLEHVAGQRGAIHDVVHTDVGDAQVGRAQRRAGGQIARGDQDWARVAGADPEGDRTGQRGQRQEDADDRAWIGAARPRSARAGLRVATAIWTKDVPRVGWRQAGRRCGRLAS